VDTGVHVNKETLKNLEEINRQVNKVREVMAEIATASEQQSQGIEQVNSAVEQMNQVTQQTAASAEESASAALELSSQAKELREMVASFQLSPLKQARPQAGRHSVRQSLSSKPARSSSASRQDTPISPLVAV
jgi:DNA repair ATPase RecN